MLPVLSHVLKLQLDRHATQSLLTKLVHELVGNKRNYIVCFHECLNYCRKLLYLYTSPNHVYSVLQQLHILALFRSK